VRDADGADGAAQQQRWQIWRFLHTPRIPVGATGSEISDRETLLGRASAIATTLRAKYAPLSASNPISRADPR
jgi:hypothetical protein